MKIILILCVAVGVISVLGAALTVILYGIADILPDTIEAIDETRAWLKKRREEGKKNDDTFGKSDTGADCKETKHQSD